MSGIGITLPIRKWVSSHENAPNKYLLGAFSFCSVFIVRL